MAIDVGQFHQTFFEESLEGLALVESELLALGQGGGHTETIHSIFRAVHSIKGGAGTFGFGAIAAFAHAAETLLEELRADRRPVTEPIVDLLLGSVDCLREMLAAAGAGAECRSECTADLQGRIEDLVGAGGGRQPDAGGTKESGAHGEPRHYHLCFHPGAAMLHTGNDPELLFRELAELGELSVRALTADVPPLSGLVPEDCYLKWELDLITAATADRIRSVFEWVEDECSLTVEPCAVEAAGSRSSRTMPQPAQQEDRAAAPPTSGHSVAVGDHGSIRVSIDKVDALINMVGELVITQSMMGRLEGGLEEFSAARLERLREGLALLERNTRELQESVMSIRMVPASFTFSRFPRLVRDLCRQLGKRVTLKVSGEQTEVDKTVMEKITDPLVHLIRNALDHGIEAPALRRAAGKPETGTVLLNAFHQGGNIVIEVSDDGAGIDRERVLAKARERGLAAADAALSDEQVFEFLFNPGFSTAEQVSDVSGRGVGMDVVRRNIRELGGSVEIASRPGSGTTFTVRLPLTLAILDGQLIRVGAHVYVIPLVTIVESMQPRQENVNKLLDRAEVYKLRNERIPMLRLGALFGARPESGNAAGELMVVVEGGGQKIGLIVDELLAQQQVVIKSLESNFRRVEGVSGATILGNGDVALILDIEGLIALARKRGPDGTVERAAQRAVA